jgi:hypothetical protein
VKVFMSGKAASGKVRVLSSSDGVVAEGHSGRTFDVPSGVYDLEVTLEDAVDRPEKRVQGVRIPAGKTTTHEVTFVVGYITLRPRRGKRPVGKQIRWRYQGGGDWFDTTTMAHEEIILSAGRYDAEVTYGRQKITISDIQVYDGKRTVSPEIHMR